MSLVCDRLVKVVNYESGGMGLTDSGRVDGPKSRFPFLSTFGELLANRVNRIVKSWEAYPPSAVQNTPSLVGNPDSSAALKT